MKSLKTLFVYLLLPGLVALMPPPGWAQSSGSDPDAAQRLSTILEQTRTMVADVDVLTLDQDGREIQESTARLVMQKPDHFYWEILSPYPELMLTDGERIWRHEPDLEQVIVDYFSNETDRTPILLLNGKAAEIAASYTISAGMIEADNIARFVLYPVASDSLFTRLSLTFDGAALAEMQFESSLGQKTSLTFSNVTRNTEIDPGTFVFEMPDGVEVIDNTQ